MDLLHDGPGFRIVVAVTAAAPSSSTVTPGPAALPAQHQVAPAPRRRGRKGSRAWTENRAEVITTPDQQFAEQDLLAGRMRCPRCPGALRPHGWARRRTVRGPGEQRLAVTPRRARCPDCRSTHVLLPGELVPRRADSASVIGQALVDKALGHGWRSIAERAGRPESTVRRWLRAAPDSHASRLQQRAEQAAVRLEPDLIDPWSAPRDRLAAALDILLRTAEAWRRRISSPPPLWAVANFLAAGCLLAPKRR